jgi:hypothetical protein
MAKISGEAIFDPITLKWGYTVYNEDGRVFIEPEYTFNTQYEAEEELVSLLLRVKELSR